MRSIIYRFSWSRNGYELAGILVLLCFFLAVLVILSAVLVAWPLMTSATADLDWRDWYLALWHIPLLGLAVFQYLRTSPRHNLLHLDEDGLTYTRMGKSHRWRWSDIAEFRPKMRWLDLVAIEFVSPLDVGWNFGVPPWSISSPASGRKTVVLPDCFEAPLDEIAAKLNECRDRALGGAAGGPEALA